MLESIRRRATGRNVIGAGVMVFLLASLIWAVFAPAYRTVAAGFDPFDVQFPLTREMMAIQRGAFDPGVELAYGRYAIVAAVFTMAKAVAVALFWAWMIARIPPQWLARLDRYGLLLLPYVTALCAMTATVIFSLLVVSDPNDPQFKLTAVALDLHQVATILARVVIAVTVMLMILAAAAFGRGDPGRDAAKD